MVTVEEKRRAMAAIDKRITQEVKKGSQKDKRKIKSLQKEHRRMRDSPITEAKTVLTIKADEVKIETPVKKETPAKEEPKEKTTTAKIKEKLPWQKKEDSTKNEGETIPKKDDKPVK